MASQDPAAGNTAAAGAAPESEAPRFAPAEVRGIIIGLLFAIFLSAIDQTIVSVALLTMANELGGVSLMAWVVSGYLVASTVATPVYGKLSDLYGRRKLLSIAIATTMVGSLLCALAQTMPQLILFRVIQGLGGGGLMALSQAIVADVAPGRERGRYQGYFSGVFATAAVVGPILGGYLTHYLSWRAIFWANLPIAALALALSHRALARLPVEGKSHSIDYAGAALLTGGLAALLIALTRIGQGVAWSDPSTPILLVTAVTLLALCGWQETRAREPILPPSLMTNHTVLVCCTVLALTFFVLIGSSVMFPLAIQTTLHASADQVAVKMLPLTVSIPCGAFMSGRFMVRQVSFRRLMMIGSTLSTAAMLIISLTSLTSDWQLAALMVMLGVGIGLPMPAALVAAQMAVRRDQVGIVTGTTAFFRTLGGAIGIAILTSLLLSHMRAGSAPGLTMQSLLANSTGDNLAWLEGAFSAAFMAAAAATFAALLIASRLRPPPVLPLND